MAKKSFIEESKTSWCASGIDRVPTNEEIQIGCMQRIAAASEAMAGNFINLQNDLDNYKRWYKAEQEDNKRLRDTIKSLRGWLTRYKNRV